MVSVMMKQILQNASLMVEIAVENVLIKNFAPLVIVWMEALGMKLHFHSGSAIDFVTMEQIMLVVIMMAGIAVDHVLSDNIVQHVIVLRTVLVSTTSGKLYR